MLQSSCFRTFSDSWRLPIVIKCYRELSRNCPWLVLDSYCMRNIEKVELCIVIVAHE